MIRMIALRTFAGRPEEGRVKKTREFTVVDERRADELVRHGLARMADGEKAIAGAPDNKMEQPALNKEQPFSLKAPNMVGNWARPLSQAGGPTGEAQQPSSSPPGRQRRRQGSTAPEGGQGS